MRLEKAAFGEESWNPTPVVVGGIPSGSTSPEALQKLAEAVFSSFEFVPHQSRFVEEVLYCLHDPEDFAVLLFSCEVMAEIFLDACSDETNFPLQHCGKQLILRRNYSPTFATAKNFPARQQHLDCSRTIYIRNMGNQGLESRLEHMLRGFDRPRVVYAGLADAFVEFNSQVAADKLLRMCTKDVKGLGRNLLLCRSPKCVPMIHSLRNDLPAAEEQPPEGGTVQPSSSPEEEQTSLIVTHLSVYDPGRLRTLLGSLLAMYQPNVDLVETIEDVLWSVRAQRARVRLKSEETADCIMNAYVEDTSRVCLRDFPLAIFRDPYYIRPGAFYARVDEPPSGISTVIIDGFGPSLLQFPLKGAITELLSRKLLNDEVLKMGNEPLLKDFHYKQGESYACAKIEEKVAAILFSLKEPLHFCGRSIWFIPAPDGPVSADYVHEQVQVRRRLRWKRVNSQQQLESPLRMPSEQQQSLQQGIGTSKQQQNMQQNVRLEQLITGTSKQQEVVHQSLRLEQLITGISKQQEVVHQSLRLEQLRTGTAEIPEHEKPFLEFGFQQQPKEHVIVKCNEAGTGERDEEKPCSEQREGHVVRKHNEAKTEARTQQSHEQEKPLWELPDVPVGETQQQENNEKWKCSVYVLTQNSGPEPQNLEMTPKQHNETLETTGTGGWLEADDEDEEASDAERS